MALKTVTPKKLQGKFVQGYLEQPWAKALDTISKVSAVPIRDLVTHSVIEFIKTKVEQFCLTEIKQYLKHRGE